MYFKLKTILFILLVSGGVRAQNATLDQYILEALESNIALRQKELSYEKSMAALKEAKARFFPTVSLEARYSVARGGRDFDIPVGDLMNPVYANLNLLNNLATTDPSFPSLPAYQSIENNQVKFLREREHETKLRLVFPIFNAAILYNHRISQNRVEMERVSADIYKRELVREVKIAYFNYLKTVESVQLFENTKALVEENLRTVKSLHKYQKVTIDEVFAAEAQLKEVEQQLVEAQKNEHVSQAFFNFLLNRDYDGEIERMKPEDLSVSALSVEQARNTAFHNREELQQFNYYRSLSDNKVKLDKGGYLPNLSLVGDYGFQGETYSFTGADDFAMGSLVLRWDVFNKQTKNKVQQSIIERQIIEAKREAARQQIGLQAVNAFYDLKAASKSIELGKAQVESAQKAFRLVEKKYSQGQANLVQFTDARTRLTNAGKQLIIAKYDFQIKLAEFERAAGTFQFSND